MAVAEAPWGTMTLMKSRVTIALIGAIVGLLLALFLELIGHPSWYIVAMLAVAIAPSLIFAFLGTPKIDAFRWRCSRWPRWNKYGLILLMIAIALGAKRFLDSDPRHYTYLPLLAPVVVSGTIFGWGSALFALFVTIVAADIFFVHPPSTFALSNWEDVGGLLVFATLGAGAALAVDDFLSLERT
jgi:hypothetical protein